MPRWPEKKVDPVKDDISAMNDLALRVWDGQSVSLSLRERVERVVKAVVGQGYEDIASIKLPATGFEKFL